ncbi:BglG family transcription antiterminator [Limosilactobacillus caecicola]|uniref:BglG family transcription antiterminator n=1 Tax=Limosilactobacillus caecicola TaxID=2941332 RepID=UPI00203DB98B|nr:BglG family transcription antiterminator [Limosilactobacillus caecicola]
MEFKKVKHGKQLLNVLIKSPTAVSLETLETALKLSRRSIFYTIKKINETLTANGLDEVENIRGIGYRLPKETRQALLKSWQTNVAHSFIELFSHFNFPALSKDDRVLLIAFCLMCRNKTSLNQLTDQFEVSKNTIITDLKTVKTLVPPQLSLKNTKDGKYFSGNENVLRRWVFENFRSIMELIKPKLTFQNNERIKYIDQLNLLERITGNAFTDDSLNLLTAYISWIIERAKAFPNHKLQNQYQIGEYSLTYTWAKSFLNDIGIASTSEAIFLAEIVNTQAYQHISEDNPMIPILQPLVAQIIQRFNTIADVNLPFNGQNLKKNLTIHLISTYYRVKYQIKYKNPLVTQIKESYQETFEITKLSIKPFEQFTKKRLSDDEIALITVYFSSALRNSNITARDQNSAMVICSSGIGTSELLISQLRAHYPNVIFTGPYNIFQYENADHQNTRLILSTMALPKSPEKIPMIKVPVIPTNYDWQQIDHWLQEVKLIQNSTNNKVQVATLMDIIAHHTRMVDPNGLEKELREYIQKSTRNNNAPQIVSEKTPINYSTALVEQAVDWKTAIQKSLRSLEQNKTIEPAYTKQIIKLTEEHGDYMAIGNGIFLAHATPSAGVNHLGFSYTLFKQPFKTTHSSKEIRLVVGLAPVDQHQHLRVLANLLEFVQNDNYFNQLSHIQTLTEFNKLLQDSNLLS